MHVKCLAQDLAQKMSSKYIVIIISILLVSITIKNVTLSGVQCYAGHWGRCAKQRQSLTQRRIQTFIGRQKL